MSIEAMAEWYSQTRTLVFHRSRALPVAHKAALALGMACLTGLLAQVRVYLPWTPVPITMQTLGVLLAGIVLGNRWGAASMLVYVGLGVAGLPWFAGLKGGSAALFGPTGGYLAGFVFAAAFVGYACDHIRQSRRFLPGLAVMLFAWFLFVHGTGLLWLYAWANLLQGKATSVGQIFMMGTVPFVAGDLLKIVLAAGLARTITPKAN